MLAIGRSLLRVSIEQKQNGATMKVEIENEASFLQAIRTQCNLFLGAGFSVLAEGAAGPMPVGPMLANELRNEFGVDPGANLDLPQLYTVIQRSRADDLDAFLRQRFTVTAFDDRYRVLERLSIRSIFTTNIDNLLTRVYEGSRLHYLNDVFVQGAALSSRSAIELVQLHGSVASDRPFTFSTLDLAVARTTDPDQWALFRQRLKTRPTIYWGYALQDAGTLQTLRDDRDPAQTDVDAWIQVRRGAKQEAQAEYFRALGFQIIVGETDELLDYLAQNLSTTAEQVPSAAADLENVPSSADAVVRPIEDYFLGAPPTWSDVYSTVVPRTSHYRPILDRVAGRKSTVLTGIPGAGKTSLLMQVAAHAPFDGPKMMYDGLSEPHARLIAEQIGHSGALIVLDNVGSDIGALEVLAGLPNTVVIAADRDYSISSVSNRLRRLGIEMRSVTSLSDADEQAIWNAIPVRIRRNSMVRPEVGYEGRASTFELIMANVTAVPMSERLIEFVDTMWFDDRLQARLLLLACYLHYARTPLSMDLLIAFFREDIGDYREVYELLRRAGELLFEDIQPGDEQDYFQSRSLIVSQTVLFNSRVAALRDLLTRFHHEVSPRRVSELPTFRRRGYHWRLFARAFPNVAEGTDIYDRIAAKDSNNPFVHQQKALYLADRHAYPEAFTEIEIARNSIQQHRTNWTIENSYNKILFNANIHKAAIDSDTLELCLRALTGLALAFDSDSRKSQHAMIYADCALRLSESINGDVVVDTLRRAGDMLEIVGETEDWMSRPRHLAGQVRRRLREVS